MKSFSILALILIAVHSVSAEELEAGKVFTPTGVIPFKYDEQDVNVGVVQRIEFTARKCNLTLKNRGAKSTNVNVSVYILNKDGVVLWVTREHWLLDSLDAGAKFAKDYDVNLSMPESMNMSKHAVSFDLRPKWIVVQ